MTLEGLQPGRCLSSTGQRCALATSHSADRAHRGSCLGTFSHSQRLLGADQGLPGSQGFNTVPKPGHSTWSLELLLSLAGQGKEWKLSLTRNLGASKPVSVGNQKGNVRKQKKTVSKLQLNSKSGN